VRRLSSIPSAAGRLTELIAMTCLPDAAPAPGGEWLLWLDLWALSPRSPDVAAVRRTSGQRWREAIAAIVLAGQKAGEFVQVDADDFALRFAAGQLGFT
jgi:hypothetical protein